MANKKDLTKDLTKEERIKEEYDRLVCLFSSLPGNELAFLSPQLQNSAFMKVTLEDLQRQIIENGVTDKYQNGENQYGTKASADLQAYNATVKNYNSLMEKLLAKLPGVKKSSKLAELMNE